MPMAERLRNNDGSALHPAVRDLTVQSGLLAACAELTGTEIP